MMKTFYYMFLFFWGSMNLVFAQEAYQAHTQVQLVSEQDSVVAGSTFWAGLDFKMEDGMRNEKNRSAPPITRARYTCLSARVGSTAASVQRKKVMQIRTTTGRIILWGRK